MVWTSSTGGLREEVGVPLVGERACHLVRDPSCLAACFLWFLSAGHLLVPDGGAERPHSGVCLESVRLQSCLMVLKELEEPQRSRGKAAASTPQSEAAGLMELRVGTLSNVQAHFL